jgi:hypothetical protein
MFCVFEIGFVFCLHKFHSQSISAQWSNTFCKAEKNEWAFTLKEEPGSSSPMSKQSGEPEPKVTHPVPTAPAETTSPEIAEHKTPETADELSDTKSKAS